MSEKIKIELCRQELDDLVSALGFFHTNYPPRGAEKTLKAMAKLEKKLWKALRNAKL